jgi:hypothetical protein
MIFLLFLEPDYLLCIQVELFVMTEMLPIKIKYRLITLLNDSDKSLNLDRYFQNKTPSVDATIRNSL